jgi:hypothetical protein
VVASPTLTTQNGSKLGKHNSWLYRPCFEPIDEFKGDIARMYFYFATVMKIQLLAIIMLCLIILTNKVLPQPFAMLAWHNQDPVNPREIAHNNAIYARQNNRNPFIDNPQYVNAIWKIEAVDRASSYCCNKSNSNQYYIKLLLYLGQQQQNNGVAGYDIYVNGT